MSTSARSTPSAKDPTSSLLIRTNASTVQSASRNARKGPFSPKKMFPKISWNSLN
ncbi:hypothetical protein EVA_11524 [gut metagenome]|uniref:Uncharacterized protein n=1 Tax=gut metagenome TaxID=749906 RepID=J9FZG3_9ZZZZ